MPDLYYVVCTRNNIKRIALRVIMDTSTKMTNATNMSETDISMQQLSHPGSTDMTWDDATWILTSSFIIFTMQSGMSSKQYL